MPLSQCGNRHFGKISTLEHAGNGKNGSDPLEQVWFTNCMSTAEGAYERANDFQTRSVATRKVEFRGH